MYTTPTPIYIIFLIVFVVIGIITIYFIIAIVSQQQYIKRLRQSKTEAEIKTLENERKRMAADIHDDLGPLLSAAKLKYSEMEILSPDDQRLLIQGHKFIDEVVNRMRQIARDMMPAVLLYNGPVFAVKEFIESLAKNNKVNIEFDAEQIPQLSDLQSLHIYRILMEIIYNTTKHAGASKLKIVMYIIRNKLIISTIDDGKGFNYKSTLKKGGGLGLYNIQSRIDMLNGEIHVKSKIDHGTSYYISIPL